MSLDCNGISRVDLILGDDGKPYFLEVNTIPGMTSTSLVPKAAAAAGIGFETLVEIILNSAGLKV
jgi:D-alanine-D-alanine ligase